MTLRWFFDPDETIAPQPDLKYLLNYVEYDQRNQQTWNGYFTWNEMTGEYDLVVRKDFGYAAIKNSYDKTLWAEKMYIGENYDTILLENDGYAIMEREYNDKGQLYRVYYYDEKRELTEMKDGYAVVEYKYDDSGNDVARVYYDRSMSVITR